jgi:hypothetical protein
MYSAEKSRSGNPSGLEALNGVSLRESRKSGANRVES